MNRPILLHRILLNVIRSAAAPRQCVSVTSSATLVQPDGSFSYFSKELDSAKADFWNPTTSKVRLNQDKCLQQRLFSSSSVVHPFCLLFLQNSIYKLFSNQNEATAFADIALTLVYFLLFSALIWGFVYHYRPSHLLSSRVRSHPLPHP